MSYREDYEDILNYPLPDAVALTFYGEIVRYYKLSVDLGDERGISSLRVPTREEIKDLVQKQVNTDYRNTLDYLLADNNRGRAIAAMQGPMDSTKKRIVDIWKQCTSELTAFDKIMLGWDKI